LLVSPIGFGTFKIGRTANAKYLAPYQLPTDEQSLTLLDEIAAMGINYLDSAPAYGCAEQRVGEWVALRTSTAVISTKVGEWFSDAGSTYDFSKAGVEASMEQSRARLGRDVLDLVFIHSDGNDLGILRDGAAVLALRHARERGVVRGIGFSGKTVAGATAALEWADAIMVEYHLNDRTHEAVMVEACERGVGVVVKKGLASGRLDPAESIRFVLANPHVTSLVIGGLNAHHIRENLKVAASVVPPTLRARDREGIRSAS